MLSFYFLEKGLEMFCMIFQGICFMLYSINWPNFIAWLLLILKVLVNMCIAIVYFPGCDVINFEINLIFQIKLFFCVTKKSRQKSKYFENEESF